MSMIEDYNALIASKIVSIKPAGFEPIMLNDSLFDWQRVIVSWAIRNGRAALFEDCGLGKTLQQLTWAWNVREHTQQPVLILCPLAVAEQTVREGVKFGYRVNYCKSQSDVVNGINITNYEKLDHFEPSSFEAVVLDECFAPETKIECFNIDTISELRYIKDVRAGDQILNAKGIDYVKNIYKRRINRAVHVTYDGQTITCSENHPFFTMHGWKSAQHLQPGDYLMETGTAMRLVRADIPSEICGGKNGKVLRSILLSEMEDEHTGTKSECPQPGSRCEARTVDIEMVEKWRSQSDCSSRTDSEFKPDEQSRVSYEGVIDIAEDEAQTFRAWGKWSRDDVASAINEGCFVWELDTGIFYITGKTNCGISDMLQGRLRESRLKNSDRDRRRIASFKKSAGSKKGCKAGFIRVESVEILEQGHPELEKYRDADGNIYFYDIKAEQHPSFSVNRCLVHNSSILKSFNGKMRQRIAAAFKQTPYKLCCSATPAPNDYMEFGQHSEFLGVMDSNEMLSRWFINDTMNFGNYRLKGHARKDFWRWVATWAACISKPSDIGFNNDGYDLPKLNMRTRIVSVDQTIGAGEGELLRSATVSATTMHKEMRMTCPARVAACKELVDACNEEWVIWCNTNYEADALKEAFPHAVEVRGSDSEEEKERKLNDFTEGRERIIISKPSIAGLGLNWQHCRNHAFVGLSYSFEDFYQAMRRGYRFGQKREFNCWIIQAETEGPILATVQRKMQQHNEMKSEMKLAADELRKSDGGIIKMKTDYTVKSGRNWTLYNGDCVRVMSDCMKDESIDFSVYSPPFANLYIYSDDLQDMGNCEDDERFFEQYKFVIKDMFRITKPGCLTAVHCKNMVAYKGRDGMAGLKDFRGAIIREHEAAGWQYHSEHVIWKDPVIEMQRTKAQGLLFKQLRQDSRFVRSGMPEYLLLFRKWGAGMEQNPVAHEEGKPEQWEFIGENPPAGASNERHREILLWQKYASPVWMDISQTRVLNAKIARENQDEKHICPLQLDVIERALWLYTNKGDLVFSPFSGIGSEGVSAIKMWRRFVGAELKQAYYDQACAFIGNAEAESDDLFSRVA